MFSKQQLERPHGRSYHCPDLLGASQLIQSKRLSPIAYEAPHPPLSCPTPLQPLWPPCPYLNTSSGPSHHNLCTCAFPFLECISANIHTVLPLLHLDLCFSVASSKLPSLANLCKISLTTNCCPLAVRSFYPLSSPDTGILSVNLPTCLYTVLRVGAWPACPQLFAHSPGPLRWT